MASSPWGSDVPISQPLAPDEDVLVDFGGFGFSTRGMVHNLSDSDAEEMFTPTYAPEEVSGG